MQNGQRLDTINRQQIREIRGTSIVDYLDYLDYFCKILICSLDIFEFFWYNKNIRMREE